MPFPSPLIPSSPLSSPAMPAVKKETSSSSSSSTAVQRTKASRSKDGCLVCRSRRVKCDLGKPECEKCKKYGAECKYPEKKPYDKQEIADKLWRRHHQTPRSSAKADPLQDAPQQPIPPPPPPSLARTVSRGPDISPAAPSPLSTSRPTSSIRASRHNTPPNGMFVVQSRKLDPFELLMALCRDTRMGQFFSDPVDPPDFLREAFPDADELRCFHHCFTYTLSTFVTHEEVNPWIDHVVPLLMFPSGNAPMSTQALKLGILATGAVHLASLEEKGSAPDSAGHTKALAYRYREEGMKILRIAQRIPIEMASDDFLAAGSMFSWADFLGANPNWGEVLRICHASIRYRGGCEVILFGVNGTAAPTPLAQTLIEFFVLVDICSALGIGKPCVVLTEASDWWWRLRPQDPDAPDSFELSIGWSRDLVMLIVRLTNLLAEAAHLSSYITPPPIHALLLGRPDFPQRVLDICSALDTWRRDIYPTIKTSRARGGSLAMWYGLQIMLLRELLGKAREDAVVQAHADEIFSICETIGAKLEGMNWPLTIACSVTVDLQKRERARRVISSFIYQLSYELHALETVVEECWRRIDAGQDDEACSWRVIPVELGCAVPLG
ncbi:hypothetical protein L202_04586 [Cryptococcus amylolentus CBS 6039]|uniref:Zn(2)-C6 fungal-type domain-containing protein n=1 Tax=Cryptococcus amylolentus CBS 6039 TaxID=1295533 RepID=A0A1E3HPN1_9TREE|nr:hypothetical protein L202_04586 [Cryptococcus amylolentus CBS 6039]ODN77401.1 hypothetical protein L202_04586 [Cryptococcus amylolentus CBS 6039]